MKVFFDCSWYHDHTAKPVLLAAQTDTPSCNRHTSLKATDLAAIKQVQGTTPEDHQEGTKKKSNNNVQESLSDSNISMNDTLR